MTLGEKIRYGRRAGGLSQGQLAEKLCVSRSAIAKWETDKGLPDVENLKLLSRLLHISLDVLLDETWEESGALVREAYRLSEWGRGCSRVKKDRMMKARFPDCAITVLLGRPDLSQREAVADRDRGILTPAAFGPGEYLKSVRDLGRAYYLLDRAEGRLFVTVTDTHLEIRPMEQESAEGEFRLGDWIFTPCGPLREE